MRLIQEQYTEPWQILTTCVLLNKTDHAQVAPVIEHLFAAYSSREDMAAAQIRDVEQIIAPLGLRSRAEVIVKMAYQLGKGTALADIKGLGEYALETHAMVVEGRRDFWPKDQKLGQRMIEMRMNPTLMRTHQARVFIEFLRDSQYSYCIGDNGNQSIDFLRKSVENFDGSPCAGEWRHAIDVWIRHDQFTPITERAKEIIMAIISIHEGKVIGKFEELDAAVQASPTGAEVFIPEDLEKLSIARLAEIFKIVTGSKDKVKFSDKKTAVKRLTKAIDGLPAGEAKPKVKRVASAPKPQKEAGEKTDREKMREFLTIGKEFTIDDVAALLNTTKSNAGTGVQLLKTRPGKNHKELIVEKTENGKLKVVQAPEVIDAA